MNITKEFLEKILKEPISTFSTSEGTKPGDNVAGELMSIKVTLGSGKKVNLLNKTCTDDPEFKDFATRFAIFKTENTLYQTVAPRVSELLKKKGLLKSFPIPKFVAGNGDPSLGEEFLCMEDVRPFGYSMKDKFESLNFAEVSLILKELGAYHASTYFWIKYEGEKIFDEDENLKRYRDSPFTSQDPMTIMMGKEMFTLELKSAIKLLEIAGHKDYAKRVTSSLLDLGKDRLVEMFMERTTATDKTIFPCIIHGDLWMNNVLLKYDSAGEPESTIFVDFQQSRRGNVLEDLVYFILTSTTPSFRKNHLAQVLITYFDSFQSTLNAIGCPMPLGFTRGSLIDKIYNGFLAGYLYMTFAIPLQLADPVDPQVKMAAMKAQASAGPPPDPSKMSPEEMMIMMVKGLELRSQMFHGQMLKSPRAIQRLVDITKEMADLKVF